MPTGQLWTEDDIALAVSMREEGKSDADIAIATDRSTSGIKALFWKLAHPTKRGGGGGSKPRITAGWKKPTDSWPKWFSRDKPFKDMRAA